MFIKLRIYHTDIHAGISAFIFYYFSSDAFLEVGLPLLEKLVRQGYILPATRILANITPRFFGQEKVLVRIEKLV